MPDSPRNPLAGPPLPIDAVLPQLQAALRTHTGLVLHAPPGAGKTTRAPLALLDEAWLAGRKIVMLEPRRLAARAAARRMAETLGERVGATVGYRVRLDSAVSKATRIEVVTAGVFIRQIQDDPMLDGIGAVLFDEFHERSLDVDLGLAFCLDARANLRDDLRVVAMSATLDVAPVGKLLDDAPVISSEGRRFPVETRYLPRDPAQGVRLDETVTSAIRRALSEEHGDLLVFLPGVGDIGRVQRRLEETLGRDIEVAPLYSDLPLERQDAAIQPSRDGKRRIVLATSIAETSLTIEGVRIVIDGGYMRLPRFDPRAGMSTLETLRVSRAAADQRRGRAGRLEPGVCYRLWSEAADRGLIPFTPPEILAADLAPAALEIAAWGALDTSKLAWLDPPPEKALEAARDLLRRLGALDDQSRITAEGKRMAVLGAHPRLAHMLQRGASLGLGGLAADVAALLGERDILRGDVARDVDLRRRLDMLHGRARGAAAPVAQVAAHWRRALGASASISTPPPTQPSPSTGEGRGGGDHQRKSGSGADRTDAAGILTALAYPDRVAQLRPGTRGQFKLASGRGAMLAETDPLAASPYLAIAALGGGTSASTRIFLAAPLEEAALRRAFADQLKPAAFVTWDSREQIVRARRQVRLGEIVLDDSPLDAAPEQMVAAMIEGVREMGLAALPWTREQQALRARIAFLRNAGFGEWPDLSDAALLTTLEDWLGPFLSGITRKAHLERVDLAAALRALLSWEQTKTLDVQAPTHIEVPSGSRIAIDYSGDTPALSVKLQEMFGLSETPSLAGGRVKLKLQLLSPAQRPLAVTQDLGGFWRGAYRDVKRDMKGQYPRHPWPDDPLTAPATRRAKPRGT